MKNIDIVKVKKKQTNRETDRTIYRVPKKDETAKKLSPKQKNIGLGLIFALNNSLSSVLDSEIFLVSFLRNLLSLRTVFFAVVPIVYFQLKYILILNPDQILVNLKSTLSPQNTFYFVGVGLVLVLLVIASWLADTIILSAIYRYKYQKIDSRSTRISGSIADILKDIGAVSLNKLAKTTIFIGIIILFSLSIYSMYIVGYGELKNQITLYILVSAVFSLLYLLFTKFRFYLQASVAVGMSSKPNKLIASATQSFLRPARSLAHSAVWLVGLLFFIAISFGLSYLEVMVLNSTESFSLNVLYLSLITTSIYLLWTAWTALQAGFWAGLVNYEKSTSHIYFQSDEDGGYLGLWVLAVVLLLVVAMYFAISFAFSSEISSVLSQIWDKLPDTIKINIPKPN
jgi:hypothetical protein